MDGANISSRTSSRRAPKVSDSSNLPPSTPPNNPRRRRPGPSSPPTATREPMRGASSARQQPVEARHSHGLSWSSTTRDSVVDNLLQSFDFLAFQPESDGNNGVARGDDDRDIDNDFMRDRFRGPNLSQFNDHQPASDARGHAHSASLSSEHLPQRPPSSSGNTSRRNHRSNSGSASNLAVEKRGKAPAREQSRTESSRFIRRVDSNDSGDFLHYEERARPALAGRKSVSMDNIYSEGMSGMASVVDRGRPIPSVHSAYEMDGDAAPEPGVPGGPRGLQNPTATGPVYVNAAPKQSGLRKTTTQGDLRSASKQSLPQMQSTQQDHRNQAGDFIGGNGTRGPSPQQAQASPTISPRLASSHQKDASSIRNRPGFFKRVFGGVNSRVVSPASDRNADSFDYMDKVPSAFLRTRSETSANSHGRPASQTQANEVASTNIVSNAVRPPPPPEPVSTMSPPILNKKPSSFFRRRKKSTSESLAPPPLPTSSTLSILPDTTQPSPSISSLRKVMDPLLNVASEPQPQPDVPARLATAVSDDLEIFHSGYTRQPDPSIQKPASLSRRSSQAMRSEGYRGSPPAKLKVKKRTADPSPLDTTNSLVFDLNLPGSPDDFHEAAMFLPAEHTTVRAKDNSRPTTSRASSKQAPAALAKHTSGENMRIFSAGTNVNLNIDDNDDWVVKHNNGRSIFTQERPDPKRNERVVLTPANNDFRHRKASLASSSLGSRNGSLASSPFNNVTLPQMRDPDVSSLPLPSLQVEGTEMRKSTDLIAQPLTLPSAMADETVRHAEQARKIFDGNEDDVTKSEAASWLGEKKDFNARTLEAYMRLFNFAGLNLVAALRTLAGKLLLKGETQQFDRIITTLSSRWCECNPNHGFKAQDVVHTILYSLVLLNTDLHLADIPEKMSKAAYVKNTLPTIRRVVTDAAPEAFDDTIRPGGLQPRPSLPWMDSTSSNPSSPTLLAESLSDPNLLDDKKATTSKRLSLRPNFSRQESDGFGAESNNQTNALVNIQWTGTMKEWEAEVENVLKSFWASIRNDPLPLTGTPIDARSVGERSTPTTNFGNGLRRSNSVVSKAPSDSISQYRSKPNLRNLTMNWQQRNGRSRPNLYPASTLGSSSRTSFDDNNSMWSPAQSSSWSKNSFGKTLTSASVGSFQHFSSTGVDFKHSIGFANALSQAIIREEGTGNGDADSSSLPGALLEDEALTLEGAPWAKEGLVKHKHHLETADRKAKERNWGDCFAVVSKGKLTLFAFGTSTSKSSSMGRKGFNKTANGGRAASIAGTKVGGGDWMENAEQLEVIVLRQTIASTLPPPGYSKTRPHVWALSLPSGAVHLFQVGTPEIAKEFMTTANYWGARLSKEPLSGSVSNIEYGWSDNVVNTALLDRAESINSPPPTMQNFQPKHMHSSSASGGIPRQSHQSSLRGSIDTGFGNSKARLPGDKVQIADWHPPTQSMMPSQLMEVDQLRALQAYVTGVEEELAKHNELKHGIEIAYSPRHSNHQKAMVNWQRKSEYLLREIVKFSTYADSLSVAQTAKAAFYARKLENEASIKAISEALPKSIRDDTPSLSQRTAAA